MNTASLLLTLCFIVLALALHHVHGESLVRKSANPGLKLSVMESCLNHLAVTNIPRLEKEILAASIDDISDKTGTPIGTIEYSITGIQFNTVQIPRNPLIEVTNAGLHINAPGSRLRAKLRWRYRKRSWPHISDHGTADIDVTISTDVVISITANPSDPDFGLNVAVAKFHTNIDRLGINLHGGASWLYQIFVDVFSGKIKSSVQSAINKEVPPAINDAVSNMLKTVDMQPHIHKGVLMDFAFVVSQFNQAQHRMTLGSKAESIKPGIDRYDGNAILMPDMASPNDMVHVFVSDYVLNSAGWTYWKAGILQSVITNDDLPEKFPMKLETTMFKFLIPELYNKWPDMEMQIAVATSRAPVADIDSNAGCTLLVNADLGFEVILPDKSVSNAFVLTSELAINIKAGVANGNVLTGELALKKMTIDVKSSNVGAISVGSLDKFLAALINIVVIPYVNTIFQAGFPIPVVEGFELTNPRIFYGSSFIGISSNFTFTPSYL